MKIDSEKFRQSYKDDGFVFPVDVISSDEAAALLNDFETAESSLAADPEKLALLKNYPDRLLPSFDCLIRNPLILNAVSSLLGPDLHVWSSGCFDKPARSNKIVSWHQDLTYWGLDDAEEVTVWVALTPATPESGCMEFVPGSHKQQQVAHVDTFSDDNLLSRGQEIAVDVKEGEGVPVILQPGQASFHHGHLFHSSGPNTTDRRRFAPAIRYIKTSMKQQEGQRSLVAHVSGKDNFDNFLNAGSPKGVLHDDDFELCRRDTALKAELLYKGADLKSGDRKGARY